VLPTDEIPILEEHRDAVLASRRRAVARENRFPPAQPPERPTPWRGGEDMKKLVLRVVYSGLALAALAFIVSAGAKHPH
jgi:hypothetical protein